MSSIVLRCVGLLVIGCCLAQPASAQERQGTNGSPGVNAEHPQDNGMSSVERDPFRACVAAHQEDPDRQQNCDWDGGYKAKH